MEDIDQQGEERVLDGLDDALSTDDIEPAAQTEDTARLRELIVAAEHLAGPGNDPKLEKLQVHLHGLLKEGFLSLDAKLLCGTRDRGYPPFASASRAA